MQGTSALLSSPVNTLPCTCTPQPDTGNLQRGTIYSSGLSFPRPKVPILSFTDKHLRTTNLEGKTHILAFLPLAASCQKSRLTHLENKHLNQRLTGKGTSPLTAALACTWSLCPVERGHVRIRNGCSLSGEKSENSIHKTGK